ncbi:MAG: HNH endonuclease signature motif containing protein [Microthrixaceae bacterium]
MVRASNERIEEALVDLQDELLERVAGRRFGSWRRELGAVCALLDTDGPEPLVERDDQLFLSETLDGLVDLKGTFTGSTAEELRQLVEAHTDRLYRQARRDANLTPDLPVPTRTVLRARALLELLRRGSSGEGGAPETHLNLDVEAAPVPGGTESAEPRLHGDQAPRCDRPTHRDSEPHGVEPDGHGDCGGDKHGHGTHGEAENGVCGGDKHGGDKHGGDEQGDGVHGGDKHGGDGQGDGVHGAATSTVPTRTSTYTVPTRTTMATTTRPARRRAGPTGRAPLNPPAGGSDGSSANGDVLAGAARLADGNLWRLLCNPVIHTFVTDSAHEILQMGRAVRVATPAQRRALRLRDGGCVFPGCDVPIGWTQVHHGIHWSDGGRSDLGNLCLLCTHHHEVSHRRGWDMVPDLDGQGRPCGMFRWTTPTGEVLWSQRHGEFVP